MSFAGSQFDLTVTVSLDGKLIFENSVIVSDEYRNTVEYTPTENGIHSIVIRFTIADDCVDTRYLKVFVHDKAD